MTKFIINQNKNSGNGHQIEGNNNNNRSTRQKEELIAQQTQKEAQMDKLYSVLRKSRTPSRRRLRI